ncbi:hypothetical protein BDV36DRAFT_40624 [Aspergillus pseudocaelatus]|uniref:Uncharacterized protein n=1 Tax=Aspergillus pseudocaelatus TaxID=1825620 RepID=A0ABQ6W7H8_9EURO|nr:hypothetical protein BDV36DRAFT_40624 [Aspergillus pseudocaelatus]
MLEVSWLVGILFSFFPSFNCNLPNVLWWNVGMIICWCLDPCLTTTKKRCTGLNLR